MEVRPFLHHPSISLPVLQRRATEAFADMLFTYGSILLTRGRAITWGDCFETDFARRSAINRLRKQGVLAEREQGTGLRSLSLTSRGIGNRKELFHPEKRWKRKWNGSWHVLVYDIPEEERRFRDSVRRYLRRLGAGCLQKSVWVSPDDIRPHYDDLMKALHFDFDSYLFESRLVLGRSNEEIVRNAWDMDTLAATQEWFVECARHNVNVLRKGHLDGGAVQHLAREEIQAFLSAMKDDPLLPKALWPKGYRGRHVLTLHNQFVKESKAILAGTSS